MKKKILILCSVIGVLLVTFPVTLYAENVPQDNSGGPSSYLPIDELDDYFYENYDLLPYIESDGHQYLNSGVNASSNLKVDFYGQVINYSSSCYFFGSKNSSATDMYSIGTQAVDRHVRYLYNNGTYSYTEEADQYFNHLCLDQNLCYLNDVLVHTFAASSFSSSYPIYILALNNGGNLNNSTSSMRLYYMSIYDYSLDGNNEEIGFVRSYFPARVKSSGVIGLYDSVSKTFITTSSATPFENPQGSATELSLLARINLFLQSSLSNIGNILAYIIEEPIILFFLAVGLAGAMYRWARRLVHF